MRLIRALAGAAAAACLIFAGQARAASPAQYAECSTYSTTSDTYGTACSLAFAPASTATYLILAQFNVRQRTGASYLSRVRLDIDTTETRLSQFDHQEEWWKHNALYIEQVELASGGTRTISLEASSSAGGNQTEVLDARIWALPLTGDEYAEDLGADSTTSSSFADGGATLTFTPGATADYLICGAGILNGNSASVNFEAQITVDGTSQGVHNWRPFSTGAWNPAQFCFVENLDTSSHTIKWQIKSNGSSTHQIDESSIFAVPLNTAEFFDYDSTEDSTRATTTAGEDVAGESLVVTEVAVDYLTIGSALIDITSGNYESNISYLYRDNDGDPTGDYVAYNSDNGGSRYSIVFLEQYTSNGGSEAHTLYFGTDETGGGKTAGIDEQRIILIQLEATPAGPGAARRHAVVF